MKKNAKRLLSVILALSLLMAFTISGVPYAKAETDHTESSDDGLIGEGRHEGEHGAVEVRRVPQGDIFQRKPL